MTHFPLSTSALCEDCRQIGNSLKACACCGSQSIMALSPLMDRQEQPSEYAVERVLFEIEQEQKSLP